MLPTYVLYGIGVTRVALSFIGSLYKEGYARDEVLREFKKFYKLENDKLKSLTMEYFINFNIVNDMLLVNNILLWVLILILIL